MKKSVYVKNALKIAKNYYISLRYLRDNNIIGEIHLSDKEHSILKRINDIMMLAPKKYLIIYSEIYVKGKNTDAMVSLLGCCRKIIYNLKKELEQYLERNLKEVV